MTRDILPGSRDKRYPAQKALVAAHAIRTGVSYRIPKVLEATTAILTHYVRSGKRLYNKDDNPWTCTRCQELVFYQSKNYSTVVGGFESSGLDVYADDYGRDCGVAGCRKL